MKRLILIGACWLALVGSAMAQGKDQAWLKPVIGEGYGVQVKEGRTTDNELEKIKEAGLVYVRFVIPWYEVERGKGAFVWGYFDTFVERLREHGLKAVIVLGGGHPLYTAFVKAAEDNLDHEDTVLFAPSTDVAVAAFARFAAKAVEHFGVEDIIWEIWNEPDTDRFWAPRSNVDDYIKLADESCRAMRAINDGVRVVGPGIADMPGYRAPTVPSFLGPVLQSPAMDCFDAVSLHPYRDGDKPPETILGAYDRLQGYFQYFNPKEKKVPAVLSTEWGFTLTDTLPAEQAAFVVRSFLLNTLAGIPISIWYEWRDAREGDNDPEAHFGLLNLDQTEKESYKAVAAFLPPLKGAIIEKRINTGNDDEFVLLLKKPNGTYAFVLWSSAPETQTKLLLRGLPSGGDEAYPLNYMPRRIDLGMDIPSFTVQRSQVLP